MSPESELRGIPEMRQEAHTWIDWRPTMHHTGQSLTNLLNGELKELRKAKEQGRPDSEIKLEVGDVLFSTLALDTGMGEFTEHYKAISEYCRLAGTNITTLFKETEFKNDINYPVHFFQVTSPFIDHRDARSCLRIIRKAYDNPFKLAKRWEEIEASFRELPFMDAYAVTGIFRRFIKDTLIDIKRGGSVGRINRLLSKGEWDMVPLKLEGVTAQNQLLLW